jgi:PAS domain S-box-containing protein
MPKKNSSAVSGPEDLLLYRELFETSRDGIVVVDELGRFLNANKSYCDMVGYTLDELKSLESFYAITPERWRAWEREEIWNNRLLKSGASGLYEKEYIRKDGTIFPAEIQSLAARDARGNITYLWGMVRDITDRKRAEIQFTELFNSISTGVAVYQARGEGEDFIFTNINPAGESLSKIRREEVVGRSILELFPDVKRIGLFDAFQKAWRTGQPQNVPMVEYHDNRISQWVENRVYKLPSGEIVAVYDDRTARRQAEAALRESELKYRALADSGQALIWTAGTDKLCNYFNKVWLDFTGRTLEQELGNGWADGVHPDDFERCLNVYVTAFDKREKFSMDYRLRRHDGEYRWIQDDGCPRYNSSGDFIGYIGYCLDITDRKNAEEKVRQMEMRISQAEKMEAIGTLAGGIAHDFNNVLGGIIGYTDLTLDLVEKDSMAHKNLMSVLAASDRAKKLVHQILTFSRKGVSQKSATALGPIITEVLDLLRASIPATVTIRSDLKTDVKPILADPTKIHELVLNLATNAVHAMNRKGTLSMNLYSERVDRELSGRSGKIRPGEYAVIEVRDTGCGMDAHTLSKAFDPFFTTKPAGEGTGMGLSVVLGAVQSHGGDLQVDSTPGVGTTFRIFLPAAAQPATIQPETGAFIRATGTETILFVDDELSLVQMAVEMLGNLGYTVIGKSDSSEALAYIKENGGKIDLLITDQTMPGMTGLELVSAVHAIRKDLLAILCTGYSKEVESGIPEDSGVSRLVMKPYREQEICAAIRDVLDKREKQQGQGLVV